MIRPDEPCVDDLSPSSQLLTAIGHEQWTVRREAVSRLLEEPAQARIQDLLNILRAEHRDFSRVNAALQVLARTKLEVLPELLELLVHPEQEVRAYTALVLGERGDPRAIPGLLDALTDADSNVRMHSVEALGKLKAGAAVEALIAMVEALDFELAFPATDALIAIGDQRVASRLVPLLQNSVFKVLCAEALGRLGNEEHIAALLGLLNDADVPTVVIASALSRIHQRYAYSYGDSVTIPAAVRSLASAANIQALVAAAAEATASEKPEVGTVLSWLPGMDADRALVDLLQTPPISPEVISAVSRRGSQLVPLLVERLRMVDSDGRKATLACLARIGDPSAASALLSVLDGHQDEGDLLGAIDALMRLGDKAAYGPIHDLFGHPSSRIRQAAVAAVNSLGRQGNESEFLLDLGNPNSAIRESALRAAASAGPPFSMEAILKTCGDVDEKVRRAAIDCLSTFDDPRVSDRLRHALCTDTPAVKAAAAAALARLDDTSAAAQWLAGALEDDDVWVRYFAIRSLAQMRRAEPLAARLVELAAADPATQVRLAAVEALGGCGAVGVPVLRTLVESGNSDFAQAALTACAAITHSDAQQIVVEALESIDSDRQMQAIRAIKGRQQSYAAKVLRPFAVSYDERLAGEAIEALGQLRTDDAAEALIAAAAWPSRRERSVVALSHLGDAAVPALSRGLIRAELDTRRSIVEALSRIRTADAVAALESALEDPAAAVRHAALLALAHVKSPRHTGTSVTPRQGDN